MQKQSVALTPQKAITMILFFDKNTKTIFNKEKKCYNPFVNRTITEIINTELKDRAIATGKTPQMEELVKKAKDKMERDGSNSALKPTIVSFKNAIHMAGVQGLKSYLKGHPDESKIIKVPEATWTTELEPFDQPVTLTILEALAYDRALEDHLNKSLVQNQVSYLVEKYLNKALIGNERIIETDWIDLYRGNEYSWKIITESIDNIQNGFMKVGQELAGRMTRLIGSVVQN